MALDPFTLTDVESERPDERESDRPEDREDETDRAIKTARAYCVEAVDYLIAVMGSKPLENTSALDVAAAEVRLKAAIAILEVAGCL